MKEVLKKYTFQKHERSTKKVYFSEARKEVLKKYTFLVLLESFLYMIKVFFSEVLNKFTSQKHERSTKKVYFSEA